MSSVLSEVFVPVAPPPLAAPGEDAGPLVRALLAGMYPPGLRLERRREQRYPYPKLLLVDPVAADGATRAGPTLTAAGKQLSETGLSFYHPEPLPHRFVVASLPRSDGGWQSFLVDLDWCRFTRQGWYESGGRILRPVTAPPAAS